MSVHATFVTHNLFFKNFPGQKYRPGALPTRARHHARHPPYRHGSQLGQHASAWGLCRRSRSLSARLRPGRLQRRACSFFTSPARAASSPCSLAASWRLLAASRPCARRPRACDPAPPMRKQTKPTASPAHSGSKPAKHTCDFKAFRPCPHPPAHKPSSTQTLHHMTQALLDSDSPGLAQPAGRTLACAARCSACTARASRRRRRDARARAAGGPALPRM